MITQLYSCGNNDSKINFNNTISCYQRPIINYNMNTKSKNKRKSTKEKTFNNNYINKENLNLNIININNTKKSNFFRICKNNNNKPSLSKNIAFLCGIINSMNNANMNKKIKNNIKLLIKENKTENKNDIINIDKIKLIQKWWKKIYNKKIVKIIKIQKEWKKYMKNKIINEYYFFSFKKLISNSLNNKNNNSNINLIKSFKEEEKEIPCLNNNIRKKFIFYITQKLSKFFLLILNKLNLFNFIKMLLQRINKSINQYVFYIIIKKEIQNEKIFFFETIKRQMKVNLNMNKNNINEISILLRTNIPKFFLDEFNKDYIPYINSIQESNLINTQLFLYNNENLINYIIFFLEKENKEKLNDKIKAQYKKYIKNDLNLHKLKNRNIFGLMRYINILEQKYKLNSKLKMMYYKESYHSENVEDDAINNYNDEIENIYEDDKEYIMNNNIDIKKFKLKFHFMNNNI